jgi:hypothetical protein
MREGGEWCIADLADELHLGSPEMIARQPSRKETRQHMYIPNGEPH